MSASPQPPSRPDMQPTINLQPQPRELMTAWWQNKFISGKLAIFSLLLVLAVGCAHSGSLTVSSWAVSQIEEPAGLAKFTGHEPARPPRLLLPGAEFTPERNATPARFIDDDPDQVLTPLPTTTSAPTATPSPTPTPTLEPGIDHVVIISIDGLRPDALFLAITPNLDELIIRGAYCPEAQTVKISITLPSHASMLSGMAPEKHGILWGLPYMGWPGMTGPTLFNVAHDAGLSTAMIYGKEKLNYLVLPNSVDKLFNADVHDEEIEDQALKFIAEGLTDVLFIHFPDTDRVGHRYAWMSEYQFQAITYVDALIGKIVDELEDRGYMDRTLLIITADHGGHGFKHGDDSPLDRTIPWLAVGPGVPQGVTINRPVQTYDTAATVLYALDLPIPENWDGKPVLEIFPP